MVMFDKNSFIEDDKKLKKQSKSYGELIMQIFGTVKSVYGKTIQNSYTTDNSFCGTDFESTKNKTGQSSQLEIILEDSQIKTLIFDGYAPVQSGQEINAYIFAGQEESLSFLSENKKVLIPRKLEEKENVLYLEIVNSSTGDKDTWDSVNYNSRKKIK